MYPKLFSHKSLRFYAWWSRESNALFRLCLPTELTNKLGFACQVGVGYHSLVQASDLLASPASAFVGPVWRWLGSAFLTSMSRCRINHSVPPFQLSYLLFHCGSIARMVIWLATQLLFSYKRCRHCIATGKHVVYKLIFGQNMFCF